MGRMYSIKKENFIKRMSAVILSIVLLIGATSCGDSSRQPENGQDTIGKTEGHSKEDSTAGLDSESVTEGAGPEKNENAEDGAGTVDHENADGEGTVDHENAEDGAETEDHENAEDGEGTADIEKETKTIYRTDSGFQESGARQGKRRGSRH